jgi:hypothetical protein
MGFLDGGGLPIVGGVLGAIAGGQKDTSNSSSQSGMDLAPETELEKLTTGSITDYYKQLQGLTNAGPGQSDVTAAVGSQRDLASMLESFSKGGFMPGQADITSANNLASQLFKPQQTSLDQSFQQQDQNAARLAAQLGRPINDPIIQAKLGQEKMRQQAMLSANQGAYSAEYAQNLPMQRLGFSAQLSDVRNNLASQAMSNRQAILSLGSQLREQDRGYRINTATRWNNSQQSSGGGIAGAINGGMAGVGAGFGMMSSIAGTNLMNRTPSMNAAGSGGSGGGSYSGAGSFSMPSMGSSAMSSGSGYGLGGGVASARPAAPSAGGGGGSAYMNHYNNQLAYSNMR